MFLVRLNNNTNAEYAGVEELAANIDNIFGIFFTKSPDFDTVKNLLEVITEAFKSELAGYEESFRDKCGNSDKHDKEPSL